MNDVESEIINALTNKEVKIYLAFDETNEQWLWIGYGGQGQWDYIEIEEERQLTEIHRLIKKGVLIKDMLPSMAFPGLSLTYYSIKRDDFGLKH